MSYLNVSEKFSTEKLWEKQKNNNIKEIQIKQGLATVII